MGWYGYSIENKNLSTKNTKSDEPSFRNGEIKTFPDKQKLKEFISTRSALQEPLKGVLPAKMKGC